MKLMILFLFLLFFLAFLTFYAFWKNARLEKKLSELTEEIHDFLLYSTIREESLEEGAIYNVINQVRKLEAQLLYEKECGKRRETELTQFVENMAHQMKTSVTALQIRLDMALLQSVSEVEKQSLLKSQTSLERLTKEIDRILKSSQLASGKILMQEEAVNLEELIQKCMIQLKPLAEKKSAVFQLEAQTCSMLCADPFWLYQAVENLLKNAVEHTKDNSMIKIFLWQEDISVKLRVEDSGEGIPAEELPHIFLRFHRGSVTKAGYGIGLSMTRDIVQAHHGSITAGNGAQSGAWFVLTLPILEGKGAYKADKGGTNVCLVKR